MRQTELKMRPKDRQTVKEFRSKGSHMARELNRAHILAALDCKVPEKQIMEVLGVGRSVIWRTRASYLEGGLESALFDAPRPGKPKRYHTDEEAQVAALACSDPPSGAKGWTVVLLTEAARSRPNMVNISRETVRRFLKKTASNPGAS